MLIDWFTVVAQLVNFLVLIWLMQRFLYRPVLAAIDSRERQVAAVLADADAKQAEARLERDALDTRNKTFDEQRAALWATATDEAQAERRRLLAEAVQAADATTAMRRDALQAEAAVLDEAIGLRAQQEVFAVARQTLAALADVALEDRVCAVFIGRLRALDGPARDRFADAIRAGAGPVRLRSAFDLPEPARAALRQALNETFSADVPLQFDTAPALLAGIELTAGGQRLDWSIAGQVQALSRAVADAVQPARAVTASTAAAPDAAKDVKPVAPPEGVAA